MRMEELKVKMEKVKKIKEKMLDWLELESCKGLEGFDVEAAGQVADMAKDMAQIEKDCAKAKYYEEMLKMAKERNEEGSYGYDNWRYPSSGRFASKGHGSYMGYMPLEEYEDEDWNKVMGYSGSGNSGGRGGSNGGGRSGGSSGRGGNSGSSGGRGGSSGGNSSGGSSGSGGRSGYEPEIWSGKGVYYDRYQNARRHYQESGNAEDKNEMNEHIGKNVAEVISQLREMSEDASPEQKRKLNVELTSLLEDVKKMM